MILRQTLFRNLAIFESNFEMASLDPLGWIVSLVGCSIDWLLTRNWVKILFVAVPTFLLTILTGMVWWGGGIDQDTIAEKYELLGRAETSGWEGKLVEHFTSNKQKKEGTDQRQPASEQAGGQESPSSADAVAQAEQAEQPESQPAEVEGKRPEHMVSQYGELLFRRVQLVRPTDESQFVVGTTLIQRGAIAQGQKILRNIAPDDKVGLPKAHAIMALSYLLQYTKTQDPELVTLLTHHSEASIPWEHTPRDVLYIAGDINWQKRNVDRALEIFQTAAERFPDLYPFLSQRYAEAKKPEQAKAATESGINYYKGLLEKDPTDAKTRVMITQLLGSSPEALAEAEELLRQAPEGTSEDKALVTRTISEIYRVRFVNYLRELKDKKPTDHSLLDKALEIDPQNPLVGEQIAMLLRDKLEPSKKLQKHLKDLLDSGKASTMTHAIMSEFYLARKLKATDDGKLDEANRLSAESIKELEAVFKASPMAVKYSNNLAYLYMESNRLDDALKTARTTLEVLQRSGMQGAEHVDELLDTLGWIYQKMDRSTDAVSAFELALRFNPNRIDSREKLAALYRKLGNDGVAEAHEQAIVAIKKAAQEKVEQEKAEKEKSAQDQSVENSEQPAENQQPESAQQPASDSKSEETSNAPSADPAASPGESP